MSSDHLIRQDEPVDLPRPGIPPRRLVIHSLQGHPTKVTQGCFKRPQYATALDFGTAGQESAKIDLEYHVRLLHTWYSAMRQNALKATTFKNFIATGTAAAPVLAAPSFATPPPGVFTRCSVEPGMEIHARYIT